MLHVTADFAGTPHSFRTQHAKSYTRSFAEAQTTLALALEAYAEVIRGGDDARIKRALVELETPSGQIRRSNSPYTHLDPIEVRENDRHLRRKLLQLRRESERLKSEGAASRRIRALAQEVKVLEEILE